MPLIRICERQNQRGDTWTAVVSWDSGSEQEIRIRNPFSDEEEKELEWYLEKHLEFPLVEGQRAEKAKREVIRYGESLFLDVFQGELRSNYEKLRDSGNVDTLTIQVSGGYGFNGLHWETMKDPTRETPLGLAAKIVRHPTKTSIERNAGYHSVIPEEDFNKSSSSTIRVLLVIARPDGAKDHAYRLMARPLYEIFNAIRENNGRDVRLDILRPGTFEAFKSHLEMSNKEYGDGYYSIIHFDVHGSVHKQNDRDMYVSFYYYSYFTLISSRAFLHFQGENLGTADEICGSEIANLLTKYRVALAVINACQSAKETGESESSLAHLLVQQGLPFAVGMCYSIFVAGARIAMHSFYSNLFDSSDLGLVMRNVRLSLYHHGDRRVLYGSTYELVDWFVPVAYSNGSDDLNAVLPHRSPLDPESSLRDFAGQILVAPNIEYDFVGRDLDILYIEHSLLTQSKYKILLVYGTGGVGKTTMLRHLAWWWQVTGLVERVFHFDFSGRMWNSNQILREVARDLMTDNSEAYLTFERLAEHDESSALSKIAEDLRRTRYLVVLDNLEHIHSISTDPEQKLSSSEQHQLCDLLRDFASGKTLVLLGSRRRENTLLPRPQETFQYELEGLDKEAEEQLVLDILQRIHKESVLSNADIFEIIDLCQGLPLALKLVLGQLEFQEPKEILAGFRNNSISFKTDDEGRNESLRTCLANAWTNLTTPEQNLLQCLAPFTSVWPLGSLQMYVDYLADLPARSSLSLADFRKTIRRLENWGLIHKIRTVSTKGAI